MSNQPQTIFPHLVINGAAEALEFYKKALGATETMRLPAEDGKRLMHAEISVNGARIFLMDDFPEYRAECGGDHLRTPKELGGTTVTVHMDVENCDAAVKRAADAGAKITMESADAFWGDRYGQVVDPFGHTWSFAHRLPGQQKS